VRRSVRSILAFAVTEDRHYFKSRPLLRMPGWFHGPKLVLSRRYDPGNLAARDTRESREDPAYSPWEPALGIRLTRIKSGNLSQANFPAPRSGAGNLGVLCLRSERMDLPELRPSKPATFRPAAFNFIVQDPKEGSWKLSAKGLDFSRPLQVTRQPPFRCDNRLNNRMLEISGLATKCRPAKSLPLDSWSNLGKRFVDPDQNNRIRFSKSFSEVVSSSDIPN